jgi:hypothetical protein
MHEETVFLGLDVDALPNDTIEMRKKLLHQNCNEVV